MKGLIFISLFFSALISLLSCHKSTDEPSGPCAGSQVVTGPLNDPSSGRFKLSDSVSYHMTYTLVDSTAFITFSGYFTNSCAKPQMQMVILIQGNWTTIQGKVYLSYCYGMQEEEIDVPAIWTGHWYDRKATVQRVLNACNSFPDSDVKIRMMYIFPTTGSRSTDLTFMSYSSEYLLFTATFSD
ncbi:MAG: hypothetical protein NTW31_14660 [Bacteroidetes bacterium]|nr:hypothetical protein [Bacteroidota bacterium]